MNRYSLIILFAVITSLLSLVMPEANFITMVAVFISSAFINFVLANIMRIRLISTIFGHRIVLILVGSFLVLLLIPSIATGQLFIFLFFLSFIAPVFYFAYAEKNNMIVSSTNLDLVKIGSTSVTKIKSFSINSTKDFSANEMKICPYCVAIVFKSARTCPKCNRQIS